MLDEKRIREIKTRVIDFINDGIIIKQKENKFVDFFLNNAKNSLNTARLIFDVSSDTELKEDLGYRNYNGFLWVINSAYYCMFYNARALIENEGIKIKSKVSIHSITFDVLVYYFEITGKLKKRLIEDFEEASEEALEVLGKEKSRKLIEDYFYEKNKRSKFTYEMGEIALKNKANTSLERAKKFNQEIRKILEID